MEQSALISIGLPIALMIIMAGMGLSLTLTHFRRELSHPRALVVGTLLQLLLIPALAIALIAWLQPPPMIAVGLMIVAACPGGTTSNLITYLCRGNLALSIALTVLASIATIVTLPIVVGMGLQWYAGSTTALELPVLRTIATLGIIVLLPVVLGMIVRAYQPAFALRAESFVGLFGAVVLLGLIVAITMSIWDRIPTLLAQAGPACIALNLGGLAIGIALSKVAGLKIADALTVGVELGIKNSTLGLLVALNLLQSTEASIPSAVYGLLMYASAIGLVLVGRKLLRPTA